MQGPTKQLQATAYHESGHVIAAFYLDLPFEFVTIKPDIKTNSLGYVKYTANRAARLARIMKSQYNLTPYKRIILEKEIISNFAGFFAEKKFTGRRNKIGASSDWNNIVNKGYVIHSSIDVIEKYLNYCAAYSEEIIINPTRWQQIESVAENLLSRETLTYMEIQKIIAELALA